MLADILEQKVRLMNKREWCYSYNYEVHMNIDDYHRLVAEVMKTGYGHYLRHDATEHNYIWGMEIVIDDSEKPCVKLAE